MDRMLQTFKKYVGDLDNIEDIMMNAVPQSKMQTHRFGEGIKAANELVGCLQVLSAKLNKLQTIVSKVEFSLEEDPTNPANVNMSEILLSQARDLIMNTRFIDRDLFDTELSASMGDHSVSFEMASPMPLLNAKDFQSLHQYIDAKKEEISACMEVIRALSEAPVATSDVSMSNLRGKTIGEALRNSGF
ncbi:flagellar FLiS export co-chaperone [Helicobacter trogontum]|uniref:Uncharacterized protein n=1 Tax=Helicobacter trogontum TaxID=50960 RepID=A0A099VPB3_9HELI|nr:flagellar FLiS export co-chaperone [Helicobacter trogontum]MCI5785842.1 flagellar FLiS export co-chaperone [Helicobacter trogontum]MDY5184883.1 flagellar FLiS export co-chaperone [Helicobacter trogontum]TLD84190.1 hypothetical protein LS81_003025 [Helicobacter trogontum]TLD99096.1 hypothetical protein LS80_002485 [Helicobacter trogontum]